MEYAIYHEMANNFQNLVGFVHTIWQSKNPALVLRLSSAQISLERFDQLKADPLFDQIPHSDVIFRNSESYIRLVGLGSSSDDMQYADAIILQTEQFLTTGQLKKPLFFKFLDPRLQRRINKGVSCVQRFPKSE